jgi:hypothetical protein
MTKKIAGNFVNKLFRALIKAFFRKKGGSPPRFIRWKEAPTGQLQPYILKILSYAPTTNFIQKQSVIGYFNPAY